MIEKHYGKLLHFGRAREAEPHRFRLIAPDGDSQPA